LHLRTQYPGKGGVPEKGKRDAVTREGEESQGKVAEILPSNDVLQGTHKPLRGENDQGPLNIREGVQKAGPQRSIPGVGAENLLQAP